MGSRRTFGSIKSWFVLRKARYKRLAHVHTQHLMEAMAIICIVLLILSRLFIKIYLIN
ncbi:MAG: hypothetical protein ACMUEL_05880 [Flavobacteriales bacterium Tduv]